MKQRAATFRLPPNPLKRKKAEPKFRLPPQPNGSEISFDALAEKAKEKPKKKRCGYDKRKIAKVREQMLAMYASTDWSKAEPQHFVALYAELHVKMYAFPPTELEDGKIYVCAVSSARRALDKDFGGDAVRMAEFMRWFWKRESFKAKKAGDDGPPSRRANWQLQFMRSVVNDFRADLGRHNGRIQ